LCIHKCAATRTHTPATATAVAHAMQDLFDIEEAKLVKAEMKAKAKAEKKKQTIKKREKAHNEMGRCKRRKLQTMNKAQV
jgi:hypothetical protein